MRNLRQTGLVGRMVGFDSTFYVSKSKLMFYHKKLAALIIIVLLDPIVVLTVKHFLLTLDQFF